MEFLLCQHLCRHFFFFFLIHRKHFFKFLLYFIFHYINIRWYLTNKKIVQCTHVIMTIAKQTYVGEKGRFWLDWTSWKLSDQWILITNMYFGNSSIIRLALPGYYVVNYSGILKNIALYVVKRRNLFSYSVAKASELVEILKKCY